MFSKKIKQQSACKVSLSLLFKVRLPISVKRLCAWLNIYSDNHCLFLLGFFFFHLQFDKAKVLLYGLCWISMSFSSSDASREEGDSRACVEHMRGPALARHEGPAHTPQTSNPTQVLSDTASWEGRNEPKQKGTE